MSVLEAGPGLFGRMVRALTRGRGRTQARAATTGLDVAQIEALLVEYREAKDAAAPFIKRYEAAKAQLEDVPNGLYGTMRLKRGKDHPRFDQTAGRARLVELNQEVPMMSVRGAMKVERAA